MGERKSCFVIMPYGKKMDAEGKVIDFDLIYRDIIQKPVERAGLACFRCDEIEEAGSIHEDMFEQIATADVAVVDITNLNANVFYELGARHALRDFVTIIIRKRGVSVPFNIQGLRVIEYPDENGSYLGSHEKIQNFIENGISSSEVDSPITTILARIRDKHDKSKRIESLQSYSYRLKSNSEKQIEIRTGDIRKWHDVDVWVNSENTNMQMARFYDRNLSAIIRYYGAKKNENDEIVEDTIAKQLNAAMRGRDTVSLGSVFTTSSGDLAKTHKVKMIFHVAAVVGVPGEGYRAMPPIIDTCVNRCLRRMDSAAIKEVDCRTIAFPMIGTGAGGGEVQTVAATLINTALNYLDNNPDSAIEKIIFMAWNLNDLEACMRALGKSTLITAIEV